MIFEIGKKVYNFKNTHKNKTAVFGVVIFPHLSEWNATNGGGL